MSLISGLVILASRVLLVLLFLPFSALDKALNFEAAVGQASQAVPRRWMAASLIVVGMCVEISMSTAIVLGVFDRLAAFIMAIYCVVTALLWKQFWKTADFRLQGSSRGRDTFWDFLKNLAVAGGFLLLTFGITRSGVTTFVDNPWSSTHPYRVTNP